MDDVAHESDKENEDEDISMNLGPFFMSHTVLGKGFFATVYLGTHKKTKENVAIKEIRKKSFEINEDNKVEIKNKEIMYAELLKQEIDIFEKLYHPYICRMLYQVKYNEDCYIITEYLSGKDFINNNNIDFNEKRICKIFCQVLSAVEYLHKNYIIHRDLKLENILFDEYGDAKLIDFGFCKYVKEDKYLEGSRGSTLYAAPEMIFSEEKYDGYLADIWSLGICLYVMLFVDFPFIKEDQDDIESFYEDLKNEELKFPENNEVSNELKDLLKKILEKNPSKRINLEQIKKHPWLHLADFDFDKSQGISLEKDVIPVDLEVVREMGANDEEKIKKIIKDILNNSHNKNTCNYYLKIEQRKRKNIKSIADIRPTSELFLNYINSEKSKLKYYNNDINKICELLTKKIMEQIQKETQEEKKSFFKIKSSMINDANKIENKDDKINVKDDKSEKNKGKKLGSRSRSLGKLRELKKYLKEENNKVIAQKIKVNKIKLLDKYISPVIFIHGIIDDIIYKVLNSEEKNKEEKNNFQIEINKANNIKINTKNSDNPIIKNNNFTINLIEEFVYMPTIKNADKTVSFGFYKPKNKKKPFQTIEANTTKESNKSKLFDKNKNKKNKVERKNLIDTKYDNHKSIDIKHSEQKKIKNLKLNSSRNNYKIKNGGLLHNIKNKFTSAMNSIKNKFCKVNKAKSLIPKDKKKSKPKKRSNSNKIKSKLNLNKLYNSDVIIEIISKKRANSQKISIKSKNLSKTNEKKLEIKAIKFVNKTNSKNSKNNSEINLDKNLNINELISENKKNSLKNKQSKNLINSLSCTFTQSPNKISNKKKNIKSKIKDEHNETNINNSKINKNYYKKKAKIGGKTYLIFKSDKKKNSINSLNSDNNSHILNKSKIRSTKMSPNKTIPIKTSLFTKRNLNIKKSSSSIIPSSSKNNKYPNENNNKNKSTIDIKSKVKKIPIHNNKVKTQRNSLIKKIRSISIDKGSINKNQGENKYEIKTKKNYEKIKDLILNYAGEDNTTVSISKTGIKFGIKMFYGKKKIEFKLFLIKTEKNEIGITGELIEGDNSYFDKIFSVIKDKLK